MELPINQLKLMRYEKIIPDLSKKDFYALKKSIEKWGIIEPIVINQDNVIICGKERYRAALTLGIEKVPVVVRKTNGDADIRDISIEENLRRRHVVYLKKNKEINTFYELKGIKRDGKRGSKKRKYESSRKAKTKQLDISEQRVSRYCTPRKLIPKLSELLDEGAINQKAASNIQRCLSKIRRR